MQHLEGPYYSPALIGPNGKLARLHKGAKIPAPVAPPPPVRESNRQVAAEGDTERAAALKRKGYLSTLQGDNGGGPKSLLGNYDQPGTRSLL